MEKTADIQPANDATVDGSADHAVQSARQAFSVVDPATGKRRTVREMSDAELRRYFIEFTGRAKSETEHAMYMLAQVAADANDPRLQVLLNLLEQTRQVAGFAKVLEYEQNRRQFTIALVTP